MRVLHGRVEQGGVVVDEVLPEGAEVIVVVSTGEDGFELDEEQIAELCASIDEADRGELLAADIVFERIRRAWQRTQH